ncbi:outer membrane beta-barrel protein [Thalassotalea agarivorans]|uniref:Opacity protein n=1 Tax=Thalassotalea agarivorans TaxID=349064 RepID=A0A1I0GJD1_THASX|nr:outer membrane beta-barrel protein [Thalassotalea agarivorans]SET71037.1 Opacity protein [Thalassotalea agarivorans]
MLLHLFKLSFSALVFVHLITPAIAATYNVTSTNCLGSDSITEAISLANANPGEDTIEISSGISISGCGPLDPRAPFYLVITDSLIINGNFSTIRGFNDWLTPNGNLSPLYPDDESCPSQAVGWKFIGASNGLFQIGEYQTDNSGLVVKVNDLFVEKMSMLAEVEDNASLELTRVFTNKITSLLSSCQAPLIFANPGADISIESSLFQKSKSWSTLPPSVKGMIKNSGSSPQSNSELLIKNSTFDANYQKAAIVWRGDVNIVSSKLYNSGGLFFYDGTANLINSIVFQDGRLNGRDRDWIFVWDADLNVIASTLSFGHTSCDKTLFPTTCVSPNWPNFDFVNRSLIMSFLSGSISFKESAVQVRLPSFGDEQQPLMRAYDASTITADANTFIQPVPLQDATALETLTSQPSLLTGSPSMPVLANEVELLQTYPPSVVTPIISQSSTPGILIDAIDNAGSGQINELLDHEGNPITTDALGNPRVDSNDRRNIGAVQTTLSPHLIVSGIDNGLVQLAWSKPIDPVGGALTNYDVCYGSGASPDPVALGTSCSGTLQVIANMPDTLSGDVSGLTNGTKYWFLVRANSAGGASPWSNVVEETPYGPIAAPVITATPKYNQVDLQWGHIDAGGKQVSHYIVKWRIQGTDNWLGFKQVELPNNGMINVGTTIKASVTNTEHTLGTYYEYAVFAQTTDGDNGERGFATVPTTAELGKAETGTKKGGGSLSFVLLLGAILVFRVRKLTTLLSKPLLLVSTLALSTFSQAEETGSDKYKGFTVDLGLGVSYLSPDLDATDWEQDKKAQPAFGFGIGYQFDENWSVDISYHWLNHVKLQSDNLNYPETELHYHMLSGNAKYRLNQLWGNNYAPFVMLGVSHLDVTVSGSSSLIEEDKNTQIDYGIGINLSDTDLGKVDLSWKKVTGDVQLLEIRVVVDITD